MNQSLLPVGQILGSVKAALFGKRVEFFKALQRRTARFTDHGDLIAWPDAMMFLTQEDWNEAYWSVFPEGLYPSVTRGTLESSRPMKPGEWIGVDLDGTLAEYDKRYVPGLIGPPIPLMVQRVKRWLAEGIDVRIFTARISNPFPDEEKALLRETQIRLNVDAIQRWCSEHLGRVLPITNIKDFHMHELWDDRAVRVIFNTGERADGLPDPDQDSP